MSRAGRAGHTGPMALEAPLVVVVEDDASMRAAIERMLRLDGIAALGLGSAEAFVAHRFDVLPACAVIDVNLAAVSGLTLQAWLAVDRPELPVVMVTGRNDDEVRRVALDQGCVAFLVKPFSGTALLDAVRRGLGGT